MLFLLTDSPQKLKLEKIHDTSIILETQVLLSYKNFSFDKKSNHKKVTTLQLVNSGKTPNLVLKTAKIFSKNSTTQEDITISRLK